MSTLGKRLAKSLTITREDLRVIYTPGRGVTIFRRIALMGPPRWTRVAWFLSPEAAEGYLGRADWLTILADITARREQARADRKGAAQ